MSLLDLLGSSASDAMTQVLQFTRQRHVVMADNVANIDTPGYRMRDLSSAQFSQLLERAIDASHQPGKGMGRLPSASASKDALADASVLEKLGGIVFHDDNNRSVEGLVVAMTRNASRHNQAASLLRTQVRLLRSIIAESGS